MDFVITEKTEEQISEEQTVSNEINEELHKSNIPKRIFQTHKSIQYIQSKPKLQQAMNSWRRFVPEFGYHFYTDEMCDDFMKNEMVEEFGEEIYEAYNRLPIAVMKADLWRYCIIYKYGGIYADADSICLCDPNMFTLYETQLVCAPENDSVHLCQWTFAAPPNSPLLKSIIDLAVKRILTIPEIRGEHVIHYLTGPGVFTDGIEKYLNENEMQTFNDKKQYYRYKNPTMICFMAERFHQTMIHHLFAGRDQDGWTHERYQHLM
jgi:mannosyltransferase OCH1-like enzyme